MAVVQRLPVPRAPQPRGGGGGGHPGQHNKPPVCRYWKSGTCNRNPCRFLHADVDTSAPPPARVVNVKKHNTWAARPDVPPPPATQAERRQEPAEWCAGDGSFCGVARLKGHAKAVTGVALPEGSGKLFSGSLDGTVRAWDCATGQCVHVAPMQEGEVGGLASMGPWVLVGVRGAVRALHAGSGKELRLRGPAAHSQVTALLVEDDEHLFAGAEDGAIFIWRINHEHQRFDEVAALSGHGNAVVSLAQGKGTLYSGAADGNIRLWDLNTRRCISSLAGHTSAVTALLCWEQYLLSSSGDGTVKVWRSKPGSGDVLELEVHYTHGEGERVALINGTCDADGKPVLLVSRGDGDVRVYDLPSFKARGRIRCNGEVGTISLRSPGIVLTGDGSGEVGVLKWMPSRASAEPQVVAMNS